MPDKFPVTLLPILAHLLYWGELSSAEARRLKAEAGLALLAGGNFVHVVPDAWLIGSSLARLLPEINLKEAWEKACFFLPAYRTYLTDLAAGEIARRGLEGASELVEQWIAIALAHQASAFNAFLDQIEQNDLHLPLRESTPGALVQAVQCRLQAQEKESGLDFASWNQALLSVSAPAEAVFQSVLARGALAEQPEALARDTVKLSPMQDLNAELAHPCGRGVLCSQLDHLNPQQHPDLDNDPAWHKRQYIFSSVPLLDDGEDGTNLTQEQVQAAFCQHPLSWIVIQLGLHIQIQATTGASETLHLVLERSPDGALCDLRILLPNDGVRRLSEALPGLVSGLGLHLILPFGQLSPAALGSWLEALLQAGLLEVSNGEVFLSEVFGRTVFESRYFQVLVKIPKPWRTRLVEILKGE
ncbi:hypothetical protein D4S03_07165 [bacterium]|nr:MAG: hypothetical protein D4S03_07165 [bacterium]